MSAEIPLFDVPNGEARRLLARGAPAWLFVDPIEYHGPHLSLHNDALVSAGLARDLHAQIAAPGEPMLVAANLEMGVDPTPGVGTRFVPFPVVRDAVREACRGLAELGAQRVVLMTFHGAPLHAAALQAGVELLAARGVPAVVPFNLLMRELLAPDASRWPDVFELVEDPAERAAVMRDLRSDFHAGFLETSLALHYAPDSVSRDLARVPPCPAIAPDPVFARAARLARAAGRAELATELELAAVATGWHALSPFPGYTGRPHLARAEVGRRAAAHLTARFADVTRAVFDGTARSPAPIFAWMAGMTLGGRLAPKPRSAAA